MRAGLRRVELWLPVLLVLVSAALVSVHAAHELSPSPGVEDVDVAIVDPEDPLVALPAGQVPSGSIDQVTVDGDGFVFTGWADFKAGAGLLLRVAGTDVGPRIRARSLPRPDVVAALDDPAALYTGYSISGTTEVFGAPTCLLLVDADASRVLWEAAPRSCR